MQGSQGTRPPIGNSDQGTSSLVPTAEQAGSSKPLFPKRGGDFRCFRCRRYFTSREGAWQKWETMEAHLCHSCERDTRGMPQRR